MSESRTAFRVVETRNMDDQLVSVLAKTLCRTIDKCAREIHRLAAPTMEPLFQAGYEQHGITSVTVVNMAEADIDHDNNSAWLNKGMRKLYPHRVITPYKVMDIDEIRSGIVDMDKELDIMADSVCAELAKFAEDGSIMMCDNHVPSLYVKQEAYIVTMFMHVVIFTDKEAA